MLKRLIRFLQGPKTGAAPHSAIDSGVLKADPAAAEEGRETAFRRVNIFKKGPAMRVIFFYPGEEGTYVDHPEVTLFENGVVHIVSNQEETTTHLQNCEILWKFKVDADERTSKVRLLKPKGDSRATTSLDEPAAAGPDDSETHPEPDPS